MSDDSRPAEHAGLETRLRWVADDYATLADLVQYDRGDRHSSVETHADVALARQTIKEAIFLLFERNGLAAKG